MLCKITRLHILILVYAPSMPTICIFIQTLEHEEINLITFTLRCLTVILITMCWKSLPENSVEKTCQLGKLVSGTHVCFQEQIDQKRSCHSGIIEILSSSSKNDDILG